MGLPGKSSRACVATSKSSATTFFIIIDNLEPRENVLTKEKKKAYSPSRKHDALAIPHHTVNSDNSTSGASLRKCNSPRFCQ